MKEKNGYIRLTPNKAKKVMEYFHLYKRVKVYDGIGKIVEIKSQNHHKWKIVDEDDKYDQITFIVKGEDSEQWCLNLYQLINVNWSEVSVFLNRNFN